jgi:hypothetical protein
MSEFSYTTASALDLLDYLEAIVCPPIVDARTLSSEEDRLNLMYELGKRELVEDLLLRARPPDGDT